jgi:hypothetical protein
MLSDQIVKVLDTYNNPNEMTMLVD